jgi:hypothetical protein
VRVFAQPSVSPSRRRHVVPLLILCFSQPLSAEASADPVKKQDGLALRLLPLHSMLAYTLVSTSSLFVMHRTAFELFSATALYCSCSA